MPMSLLWAGLIIAWLVVLVPMLVARHPKVNSVTDATLKTRLLHRGGSRRLQPRRKARHAARPADASGGAEDSDETGVVEAVDGIDEDGEVLADERLIARADAEPADADLADADLDDAELDDADVEAELNEVDEAHAFVDSDVDELPEVGPMDDVTTEIITVTRPPVVRLDGAANTPVAAEGAADGDAGAEGTVDDGLDLRTAPVRTVAQLDEDDEPAASADLDGELDGELEDAELDRELENDELATAEMEPATERVTRVQMDEPAEARRAAAELDDAEPDEVELDDAARERAGTVVDELSESRGGVRRRASFDPENDARLTAARYRFRQRVTFVLAILAVGALAAGVLGVPFGWYAFGGALLAFALYLTYLRRTVRIETDIRRRRLARLERARREREQQAEIVDGVPAHLRRYGAVVLEIDDEDPAFDHLPRYRAEEFDFLDHHDDQEERLRRAVG